MHGFNICDAWAQLLLNMWDFPGPGIKPVSPALGSGFISTVPPGKSKLEVFLMGKSKE